MSSNQEIIEEFFEEARDWGDTFIELGLEIADSKEPENIIQEVFRGVHSLKGGAGFLVEDDERLSILVDFCHKFETFLDKTRKGDIELDKPCISLVITGLNLLNDDIESLCDGNELEEHEELLNSLSSFNESIISVKEKDGNIVINPTKNLNHPDDIDTFTKLLWKVTNGSKDSNCLVIDLSGKIKMSSMALGAIIGIVTRAKKITITNPPRFMELVFNRFKFDQLGIKVEKPVKSLETH